MKDIYASLDLNEQFTNDKSHSVSAKNIREQANLCQLLCIFLFDVTVIKNGVIKEKYEVWK